MYTIIDKYLRCFCEGKLINSKYFSQRIFFTEHDTRVILIIQLSATNVILQITTDLQFTHKPVEIKNASFYSVKIDMVAFFTIIKNFFIYCYVYSI